MNQRNSEFGPINWQDYTHEHMWNMLMAADPEAVFQQAEKAATLATTMGEITTFAHAIAQDVTGAWSGSAADYAAAGISAFLKWADTTANTANSIAGLLSQYAHVLNRARLSIPAPPSAGQSVTPAQADADKTHAVHVMEHYTTQSRTIYTELGQHQFEAPPNATGLPLPAPEPAHTPHPGPPTVAGNGRPAGSVTASPGLPGSTSASGSDTVTTPSSVVVASPMSGPGVGGGVGGIGGMPGLPGGGPGGAPANGLVPGPGAMSAVGAMQAEGDMARMATAAEDQAMWNGFAPAPLGRPTGDRDGEHQDRYSGRPDLIGELPPAFPPVLGL